ncbi:(d)CMP kinase [Acidicapsa dinghuensis]|uniref:Cytidylate kinase n=1 Tax=Acidicapsa dinghuensis TaxID=2218256 RepID=A0ABW1EBD0_9BACT|nr:(d)CMP kinase [Acidicapsa dinghuensis]
MSLTDTSANSQKQPKANRPIIAIDGPAGAGKSTVARHLARYFGLLNLETGAMYRAFALKAMRAGIALDDVSALLALSAQISIRLVPAEGGNLVFLDDVDVTGQLRDQCVTDGASRVSVHPPIRTWMVSLQQQLGAEGGVVMEGRDIGTVVFPHANVKIFLDAAPEVRGMRRYEQMGSAQSVEVQPEAVVRELRARDERDRNRADSPLKAAEDAVILDSTNLTLEQVVTRAEEIVQEKLAIAPAGQA